ELEVLERPETGVVAAACGEGGLHVLEEGHEVELVGGELVVTPLGRRALPLRRYATGVRAARVEGDCACGSPLPRIEVVGGSSSCRSRSGRSRCGTGSSRPRTARSSPSTGRARTASATSPTRS